MLTWKTGGVEATQAGAPVRAVVHLSPDGASTVEVAVFSSCSAPIPPPVPNLVPPPVPNLVPPPVPNLVPLPPSTSMPPPVPNLVPPPVPNLVPPPAENENAPPRALICCRATPLLLGVGSTICQSLNPVNDGSPFATLSTPL